MFFKITFKIFDSICRHASTKLKISHMLKCCNVHLRCVDESARWLLINNRRQEATDLFKKIAKKNKKPLPEDVHIRVTVGSISDEHEYKSRQS